ncbi:MAG: heparinase II/III family protein [Lentisphaeraceae bacterium]|nr:heparinase II/III family protein [Lentisphaeraceae bacterium]
MKAVFLFICIILSVQAEKRVINNELKLNWPNELVYLDFPAGSASKFKSVGLVSADYGKVDFEYSKWQHPVQLEKVLLDGNSFDRLWFKAKLTGGSYQDSKGKTRKVKPPVKAEIEYSQQEVISGISLSEKDSHYLIDNGVYEFRLRKYSSFDKPVALNKLKHFIAGMRPLGSKIWEGKAFFEGTAEVHSVKTEIINTGPVFIDIKLTFDFGVEASGETDSVKILPGKQSHTFKPNRIPRETLPRKEKHYEVVLRFVAGDPWIDVVERAKLPKDPNVKGWGIHQYYILWGKTDKVPDGVRDIPKDKYVDIDTVSWVRWFLYDQFGGNSSQQTIPAKPRPDQKGRPFALLRPKWNQGGGGAQDFVLTSGGKLGSEPAFGIVASFASKWTNISTIAAYVRENQQGVRIPLTAGSSEENYYMTRSYAILCGTGEMFKDLNSVVRRHTDWTLAAQMNKYILSWKRDPKVAGANIMTNKKRLAELQSQAQSGQLKSLNDKINTFKKIDDEINQLQKLIKTSKDKNEIKNAKNNIKALEKQSKGSDFQIISLLMGKVPRQGKLPSAFTYLGTRYQDDANNPTNYGNRRLVNRPFPISDLLSLNKPFGGAEQAAIGYIYTDLDAWPGWHNEWNPGNPNFHTDKYIASIYAAAAMQDHPHAEEWLEFGLDNFNKDLKKVFIAPDGVGVECPGYAGFSMSLQLETGGAIFNSGLGNPFTANPLIKKNARWHRKLITPFDKRIMLRHEAPIGDTHRWDSGMMSGFAHIAPFYKDEDPEFAREMVTAYKLLKDSGASLKSHGLQEIFLTDSSIKSVEPQSLDWSSDFFYGFGAVMRNNFGTERESFLTFKAGPAHGHYHNDELSWHYYSGGTPISLDYNCSYHPRGDHAALHNTSTFGNSGKIKHNGERGMVDSLEQVFGTATVGAFVSTPEADLIVAERSSSGLSMSPVDPHDAEFQRKYPHRKTEELVHRRTLIFVKHEKESVFEDYIVVKEEFKNSTEKQQINLHFLGREIQQNGNQFFIPGQYEKDISLFVAHSEDLKTELRHWEYFDEWMSPPEEYVIQSGESFSAYDARMTKLAEENGQKNLPLKDWKPSYIKREQLHANSEKWHKLLKETKGRAMMPPKNWNSSWTYGETQQWLRLATKPGSSLVYIIYPHKPSQKVKLSGDEKSITVEVGGKKETILFSGGISIKINGKKSELLKAGILKPIGHFSPNAEDVIRIKH